jgi:hypothetical protein
MCISVRLEKDSEINSATNKNENLSFASKWMELENIIIDVGQVQNIQKIVCSLSYVDHSPKTNAVILLDMGHTPRGECAREKRKGKEI